MSFQNLEHMSQLAIAQFVYVYDEILKEKSMSHGPATGMELNALLKEAIYQEEKTEIVEDAMEEEREEEGVEVVEQREEAVEVIDLGDEPEENETPTLAPKDVLKAIKADFNYKQEVEEGMKPRVHRLNLPYLPGSIDYTQGCQAMCLNGGLCSPCMTRLPKDAGSIFCKACEKKGGCESDRATFLRASSSSKTVTFGTYLAKRNVPTEFVKEWIHKNFGDKLVIPEHEWTVVKEEIKTTKKKTKKTTKSAETSSDEESVASDAESVASVPAKKAGLTDEEKAAKKAEKLAAKEAKKAEKAAAKAEKTAVQEREKAAKKAAKEAKKAAKLANESKLLEKGSMTKKGEFGYKKTKAPLTEEEKAAKKAAKALKKAAKKAEEEKAAAAAEERSANVPQEAEECSANVPQEAPQEEEEEDDYGIKMFFALNGKSYGVDEENTVYEMEGKQPAEIVGTWDNTYSTAVFHERD